MLFRSCIGAALANPTQIHFCVLGDLSFFYDMNSIGNRDVKNNVRILLINNNGGNLFKQTHAPGHSFLGDEVTGQFIGASGHFGNQSKSLVKHIAEDLGYKYLSAKNKEEFKNASTTFLDGSINEKMIFEIFTTDEEEREAFDLVGNLDVDIKYYAAKIAKKSINKIAGEKGIKIVEKAFKKK